MELIRDHQKLASLTGRFCVGIGVFDGVHLGHQQVLRQTIADARRHEALAVAITFDRHPNAVVAPDRVPPTLQSTDQKLRALEALGLDLTCLIRFDDAFSRQSGEVFVRQLAPRPGRLLSVSVGSEFTFGHRRSGNVPLLRQLGAELGFDVHGLAAVALDGQVVSSTRIREAVRAGQLDDAGQMLGRPFALDGQVVHGDQRGRTIGFPTANLEVTGRVLPPNGVYAAHARVGPANHRAVVNIGLRPTIGDATAPRVEAHLLDFSSELYQQTLELTFAARLREERRFDSLDALQSQIAIDAAQARQVFTGPIG